MATFLLKADRNCLDNSYHVSPWVRYDYKNYHRVQCTCRCDGYAHLLDRGTCRSCGHYRKPKELKIKQALERKAVPVQAVSTKRVQNKKYSKLVTKRSTLNVLD